MPLLLWLALPGVSTAHSAADSGMMHQHSDVIKCFSVQSKRCVVLLTTTAASTSQLRCIMANLLPAVSNCSSDCGAPPFYHNCAPLCFRTCYAGMFRKALLHSSSNGSMSHLPCTQAKQV